MGFFDAPKKDRETMRTRAQSSFVVFILFMAMGTASVFYSVFTYDPSAPTTRIPIVSLTLGPLFLAVGAANLAWALDARRTYWQSETKGSN